MTDMICIDVLGTQYSVQGVDENDKELGDDLGNCDRFTQSIKLNQSELEGRDNLKEQTIRHEIIHAFLFESGLAESSCSVESWAVNEEMVDWFAFMNPKIEREVQKVLNQLDL